LAYLETGRSSYSDATSFQAPKEIFRRFIATDGAGGESTIIERLFAIQTECWRQRKGAKT